MSETEFGATATRPAKMVSKTALNVTDADGEVSCRPTILLLDPPKKGNKKSEETVHIPTDMELASAVVSELEQQQSPYLQQPQPTVVFTSSGGKAYSSRIHIKRTECTSAVTDPVSSSEKDFHVVKIQISPNFRSGDSNGSSTDAAIDRQIFEISPKNTVAATGDEQCLEKTIFLEDQHPNIPISVSDERSTTVLVKGDLELATENTKSLTKIQSDLASDLCKVQHNSKAPKVSIVSFISDDYESIRANGERAKEDQSDLFVRSVESKKNISQTFLSASSEDISILVQDSELSSSKPVILAISVDRSALSANTEEIVPEFDSLIPVRPVSASSPVPSAGPLEVSVGGIEIERISGEAASSSEQLPTATTSVGKAVLSGKKAIQVLNTRVIVDIPNSPASTITSNEMVQKPSGDLEVSNPTYLYYMMTSGQCSPSDTLDSGTCSDMENSGGPNSSASESLTPPPLPKKMGPKLKMMHLKSGSIISEDSSSDEQRDLATQKPNGHVRTGSFTDSDESESSLSCDSLNSSEFARSSTSAPTPPHPPMMSTQETIAAAISMLPDSLLRDIRDRKFGSKENSPELLSDDFSNGLKINDMNMHERNRSCVLITQDDLGELEKTACKFESDKFYNFHINEKDEEDDYVNSDEPRIFRDDESFAGYKDIHSGTSTIRSSKGTVRGVKNRVRNGIATFLQMQQTNVKNYKEKDSGKVVLYTTSMGIIRETYAKCANVKQILRTLLIKFEERDVFMSMEYQQEIKERMQSEEIQVPQLFVEGQYIGDAATVERLNESGELRQMLKPYKSMTSSYTCQVCGGYRLLPCQSCNGSKKSVHRNHFTTEFVALKCMNCDEVGLVKCHNC